MRGNLESKWGHMEPNFESPGRAAGVFYVYVIWIPTVQCFFFIPNSLSDRWADLYGECVIDCHVTSADGVTPQNVMTCKLDFLKSASGYWSNGKRHEVQGTIINNKTGKNTQPFCSKI